MKYAISSLAIILLVGLGVFIGKEYFSADSHILPTWSDSAIKKINKHALVEFRRNWSKTIEDDKGPGKGIIEYSWHFTYLIGIDVPNKWNWNIKRNSSGEISVSAPKLSLINEPQFSIDEEIEFNEANGDRQQRMRKTIQEIGMASINKGALTSLKKNSQIYQHAKLSLESFLLNLLNQANPQNPSNKLTVTFEP